MSRPSYIGHCSSFDMLRFSEEAIIVAVFLHVIVLVASCGHDVTTRLAHDYPVSMNDTF